MHLDGNLPFITEDNEIGFTLPSQITPPALINYVESELLAVQDVLVAAQQNEYARVDQGAAWALLARLYLNAEVYLGQGNGKYTEAVTYASKVIGAGYSLMDQYEHLFMADNDQN